MSLSVPKLANSPYATYPTPVTQSTAVCPDILRSAPDRLPAALWAALSDLSLVGASSASTATTPTLQLGSRAR